MAIYLLVKGLPKKAFVGTGAWFFLIVNLIKVPFYINLGLIHTESLTFNLWMLPAILIGAFLGIRVLHLLQQKNFLVLILLFASLGALKFFFLYKKLIYIVTVW